MRAPDFWRQRNLVATLLAPLGALYGFSVALKARFARPFDSGLPVICVGNLTAGGSGKTPVAIAIADRLRAKGHKPFFLTRGYGGSERGPAMASRVHSAARVRGCPCPSVAFHVMLPRSHQRAPSAVVKRAPWPSTISRGTAAFWALHV